MRAKAVKEQAGNLISSEVSKKILKIFKSVEVVICLKLVKKKFKSKIFTDSA